MHAFARVHRERGKKITLVCAQYDILIVMNCIQDFTLGTLFIYAYAIYLGYKHGYKASDILARPNPHAQPLGDVDSTPDTTSFEESQQMSTQGASMSRNEENEEKSNSSLGLYFCMFLTMSTILMVGHLLLFALLHQLMHNFSFDFAGGLLLPKVLHWFNCICICPGRKFVICNSIASISVSMCTASV